ncbi:hypothetical protein PG994_002230 [Apiospora phragmitis]|uniref:Uncharacterized protein n=1 Tax=Apiospora phragmitis TaxID=2905665 RepID=A0ABR1WVT7_9PEZI
MSSDGDDAVKPVFSPSLKQVITPDGAAPNTLGRRLFHALWRRFWIQVSRFLDRTGLTWRWRYSRDAHDHTLSRHQCRKAFPGLFDELLRAKQEYERYHINLDDLEAIDIKDGRVRVAIFNRQEAISAAPRNSIPNIEFVLDVRGQVADVTKPAWVLDRREHDDKVWLTPFIGSLETSNTTSSAQETKRDESQAKVTFKPLGQMAVEIDSQESQGSSGNKGRQGETKDASATDDWGSFLLTNNSRPDMFAPDVCRHKILVHPGSQSTFNRLDSLLCASVNVMQNPKWIHLYHGLMYSKPRSGSRTSLPEFQNVMLINNAGPDLKKGTPSFLRNTEVANTMASNAVETFRRRYLTEASTACYWRELVHTYSEVSYSPKVYDEMDSRRGVPLKKFL